ncbi:MAG: N-acetylmuramoyl-L-alanine amidase [Betaproteobacteria bacterium HGW-Betaproteobacteria-7]|jgi:N-acetylmuramoyl-L-alanine amidase|nr:MAG: N-acetylmuramoyl-L-alanine amidase [Betaproteobacteria bacterium HGW-Betaproteobacteria-7]
MPHLLFYLLTMLAAAPLAAAPLVAVDVGHGLVDSGAISARGRSEFEFNRQFATVLGRALEQRQIAVRRVNFAGDIGSLQERPQQAAGSDFFLSVHHDSISPDWLQFWDWDGSEASYTEVKRGFGLFVSAQNPDLASSLRCASTIGAVLRRNGFTPSSWHGRKHLAADGLNGVWYYDNLVVLYRTTLPAVLFEAGVIKHREEELELLDPQRQARMADAVATGIAACLFVTGKSVRD